MRHKNKYKDSRRKEANRVRFENIINNPKPDYPEPRKTGRIISNINGKRIVVVLEPYIRNITQWVVTINGELFSEHCGMGKVYEELARLLVK